MNLKVGGEGGRIGKDGEKLGGDRWAAANRYWKTEEGLKKKSETAKKVVKRRIQEGTWNVFQKGSQVWKGRKHTPESIEKMKETKKGHGKGVNNSQFGKCWITNEVESKKINKGDLIPEGWRLGRIINQK